MYRSSKRNPISFSGSGSGIFVVADSERFKDLLIGVLEEYRRFPAGPAIRVVTEREPGQALHYRYGNHGPRYPGHPRKPAFHEKGVRTYRWYPVRGEDRKRKSTVTIELPADVRWQEEPSENPIRAPGSLFFHTRGKTSTHVPAREWSPCFSSGPVIVSRTIAWLLSPAEFRYRGLAASRGFEPRHPQTDKADFPTGSRRPEQGMGGLPQKSGHHRRNVSNVFDLVWVEKIFVPGLFTVTVRNRRCSFCIAACKLFGHAVKGFLQGAPYPPCPLQT